MTIHRQMNKAKQAEGPQFKSEQAHTARGMSPLPLSKRPDGAEAKFLN